MISLIHGIHNFFVLYFTRCVHNGSGFQIGPSAILCEKKKTSERPKLLLYLFGTRYFSSSIRPYSQSELCIAIQKQRKFQFSRNRNKITNLIFKFHFTVLVYLTKEGNTKALYFPVLKFQENKVTLFSSNFA